MLTMTDTPIDSVLKHFTGKGVGVVFLVPTPIGYNKSIMDATKPLRLFLEEHGIHNYELQAQGPENKKTVPAFFVFPDRVEETEASLYRPKTKSGDPRIWFRGLRQYCTPQNLLAITTDGESIFVFNMSNKQIVGSIKTGGIAEGVLNDISDAFNHAADELLSKLQEIHQMGFITTIVSGDTGVGMTLENLLGIQPNSMKIPDYKGIEIKATRAKLARSTNRMNLFSQIPNWSESRLKSGKEILDEFGYIRDGRLQLYCTVCNQPNSQGLFFAVDDTKDVLMNKGQKQDCVVDVTCWNMETLRIRLKEKHAETFWVKAVSRTDSYGLEQFRYDEVIHTKSPNLTVMGQLLDLGIITMDYTLSQKGNGTRDHGYLFKIRPENLELLFPPSQQHCLSTA